MRTNLREAYRLWNHEQRLKEQWRRDLRRISLGIESLRLDLEDAVARQAAAEAERREAETRRLVDTMFDDKAFNRVLSRYWGHTPQGWEAACGPDGRMKRLLRDPGWPVLQEAIHRIRVAKGLERRRPRKGGAR